MSTILWLRGKLRQALYINQQALDLAGESPAAAQPRLNGVSILYEINDLEGAESSAQIAVTLSELGGFVETQLNAYFFLGKIQLVRGDLAGAMRQIEKVGPNAAPPHRLPTFPCIACCLSCCIGDSAPGFGYRHGLGQPAFGIC